ncbi:MAG: hypothetical protein CMI35_16780 [Owenweeksia sp.]|nr:hypothetical protein [Owenweeksia sp.]
MLTSYVLAQETSSQYANRLVLMKAEEQKIASFIDDNIHKSLPPSETQRFDQYLIHSEEPISQAEEAILLQQFKEQYWRTQYFLNNPWAKDIFIPQFIAGSCDNGGFESNDFSNYSGEVSYFEYTQGDCDILTASPTVSTLNFTSSPMTYTGDFAIVDTGADSNVPIQRVFDGQHAARINSDQDAPNRTRPENSVSKLIKHVVLSEVDERIFFHYAPVLVDPGFSHDGEKPTFLARVLNTNGIECDRLCHSAYSSDPFLFEAPPNSTSQNSPIRYRDWKCGFVDACGQPGDTVTLEFIATDCGWGGHWGYAYVDNICDTCTEERDSCNFQGAVELNSTKPCQGDTLTVNGTIDYAILNCDTALIDSVKLSILQNGADVTVGFIPVNLSNNYFSFTVTPANLPANVNPGDGFDFRVDVMFSFGPGQIRWENDYHTNPGQNNDYVYQEVCCPEFNVFTCCDLYAPNASYRIPAAVQAEIDDYKKRVSSGMAQRGGGGDPCCDYCEHPDEAFPIFVYNEDGSLVDNNIYNISWSHEPGNHSAISSTYPDSTVVVTVSGPGSCVWSYTYNFSCCENPGLNGSCCDNTDFGLDVDSLCSFDPCKFPDTQFPIRVLSNGTVLTTATHSFAWSNNTTGDAASVSFNQLPISVVVTDNATGCSDSVTYTFTCAPPCELSAPQDLQCVLSSRNQMMTWSPVANAVSYEIRFFIGDESCCGPDNLFQSFMDSSLTPSYTLRSTKCFSWQVRAICANGKVSPWSASVCSCQPCNPNPPEQLKCSITPFGHRLGWQAVPYTAYYEIAVYQSDPNCCSTPFLPGEVIVQTTNTIDTIGFSSCFSWRVRAVCGNGSASAWSDPICACKPRRTSKTDASENGDPTSLDEAGSFHISEVSLVPNPAHSFALLNVRMEQAPEHHGQALLHIVDVAGHTVYSGPCTINSENRIDLSGLIPGMYLYQVYYNDAVVHSDKLMIK